MHCSGPAGLGDHFAEPSISLIKDILLGDSSTASSQGLDWVGFDQIGLILKSISPSEQHYGT